MYGHVLMLMKRTRLRENKMLAVVDQGNVKEFPMMEEGCIAGE